MLIATLARPFRWAAEITAAGIAATGIHPNFLTWLCLTFNLWAGAMFAAGRFMAAGALMIAAGFCDVMDGPVARIQKRTSPFGAFLDSILDRYSDLAIFLGLLVYYARVNHFLDAVVVGVAMAGAVMVSYAEARADSLIKSRRVGFWDRPERIVLLILGAMTNLMRPALWILAIGPNITVIHRIISTWQQTEGRLRRKAAPQKEAQPAATVANARVLTRSAGQGG